MKKFSVLASSAKRKHILDLGLNLLIFPLQRTPRMPASSAHMEKAEGDRFSPGLWHNEGKLPAPGLAPCPWSQLRGWGPRARAARPGVAVCDACWNRHQREERAGHISPRPACSRASCNPAPYTKDVVVHSFSSPDPSGPRGHGLHHTENQPKQMPDPQLRFPTCHSSGRGAHERTGASQSLAVLSDPSPCQCLVAFSL